MWEVERDSRRERENEKEKGEWLRRVVIQEEDGESLPRGVMCCYQQRG